MKRKISQPFGKTVRNTSNILSAIGMGMLLVLMLLDTVDVIGRYLFNRPIMGTLEISEILLAGIVFFGWAYTQAVRGHIRVELFYARFSRRVRSIVGLATSFVALVLFSLIVWQGIKIGIVYWRANRLIDVINMPIAPFQFFVSFGALFLCLVLIIQMAEHIAEMRKVD